MTINPIATNAIGVQNKIADTQETLQKSSVDFSELLVNALNEVNSAQKASEIIGDQFMLGEIDSIHDVKIAGLKADLTLNLAVEVTNKVLGAYSEIMRLQL